MRDRVLALSEDEKVRCTIAYVDYEGAGTARFIQAFFPFALKRAIRPLIIDENGNASAKRRAVSQYVEYLVAEAQDLRSRAALISEHTHIHNLTPLLLPQANFSSRHYQAIMADLWTHLGTTPNVGTAIRAATNTFLHHHPKAIAPGDEQSCLSDGTLLFRSPGRHRHGYYRHQAGQGHRSTCLLNARSRLGGSYAHSFHYDCMPVRSLASSYPNCHGAPVAPKERHVNIAPNDAII